MRMDPLVISKLGYVHRRIADNHSIRILRVHPGSGVEDICIDLFQVSLDSLPSYEALSYTWEGQRLEYPIFCDGKELLITSNCFSALRVLRDEINPRLLWIDSICIDQTSVKERSQQVQLMKHIYSDAKRVLIWLGESSPESEYVIEFLQKSKAIETSVMRWIPGVRKCRSIWNMIMLEEKEDEAQRCGKPRSSVLQAICGRQWFRRVWTLQEYVLSQEALILCGTKSIPEFDLFKGLLIIPENRSEDYLDCPDRDVFSGQIMSFLGTFLVLKLWLANSPIIQGGSKFFTNNQGYGYCTALLFASRTQLATDAKDKVYGMYGLFERLGIDFPRPDYAKSVAQIFAEATISAIRHDESLVVLTGVDGTCSWPAMPSWVPDWNVALGRGHTTLLRVSKQFEASRSSVCAYQFLDNNKSLLIRGVLIDKIKTCGPQLQSEIIVAQRNDASRRSSYQWIETGSLAVLQEWFNLASSLGSYPTGEKVEQAFYRTIFLDSISTIKSKWTRAHSDQQHQLWLDLLVKNDFSKLQAELDKGRGRDTPNHDSSQVGSAGRSEESPAATQYRAVSPTRLNWKITPKNQDVLTHHQRILEHCEGMKFFTTSGGYMGLGSAAAMVGDLVVMFPEITIPMIVRKKGEFYCLISSSYVHGVMYGEMWSADGKELFDITLKQFLPLAHWVG